MFASKDGGAADWSRNPSMRSHPGRRPTRPDAAIVEAMGRTRDWLLDHQDPNGFWHGELEGDTILESEYVLLMAHLGRHLEPTCRRACQYVLDMQGPDGGWSAYPGGPADLSISVKAYFALKLVGTPSDDPAMVRARETILQAGGAQQCNSFTRFYLALLGQIPYDDCPTVPPELALLPDHFPISLSNMSAWTRTIVVPLSIISALKPVRELPSELGIAELFRADRPRRPRRKAPLVSWKRFFLAVDATLKGAERVVPRSWRERGLQAAHRWMVDHFESTDGLGAIFPPMIYAIIALKCLGYDDDSELVRWAHRHLDDLVIRDDGPTRIQPCVSPVWDTAIATISLADADLPPFHPALNQAVRWLLDREVRQPGDWTKRRPGVEPTGWHFQFANGHYPDIDDTAMVLMAIGRSSLADSAEVREATRRGENWLLAMQNRDGGWAAFDVDIDNQVLTKVPFADHNAMLDPSCADITARILEFLGGIGYRADHPAIARGLDYLWRTQEPEGCWYGRWGVNYIYGTWQVLLGLRAIGFPMDDPRVVLAADWLESVQQPSGGWGESCRSYDDPSWMGRGEPTASQTAWAVLGLLAMGREHGEAVRRGIQYLVDTQGLDGSWDEPWFTGTGFPRVFYLRYHLYRIYFPLMAMGRYCTAIGRKLTPAAAVSTSPGALASSIPAHPSPLDI